MINNPNPSKRGDYMDYRIERDSMGEVQVPADKWWGAQTQRSFNNFKIGDATMPREIIAAFAALKKACARVNGQIGKISAEKAALIAVNRGNTPAEIYPAIGDFKPLRASDRERLAQLPDRLVIPALGSTVWKPESQK